MSLIPAECAAMSSRLYFRCTRLSDGNCRPTQAPGRHSRAGRIGRGTKPPPQFGQTLCSFVSTQSAQNVHSYEQMRASVEAGGRSLSQYSQFGRSCSAMAVTSFVAEAKFSCILFELRTSPARGEGAHCRRRNMESILASRDVCRSQTIMANCAADSNAESP